jgi:hypothetical protein
MTYYEEHKEERKQYMKKIEGKTKQYQKQYLKNNRDELLQYKKEYYKKNKEKMIKQNKEWNEKNKEKERQNKKQYREEHKEEIKQYREEHKEEKKLWWELNPDKALSYKIKRLSKLGSYYKMKPFAVEYSLYSWSKTVRKLLGKSCIICGSTDGLNSHHIFQKAKYPLLSLNVNNGTSFRSA